MQNFPQQGFYLYYCMNCIIMWWQMSLQVWRMLQKPLCGNQMNLATLISKCCSRGIAIELNGVKQKKTHFSMLSHVQICLQGCYPMIHWDNRQPPMVIHPQAPVTPHPMTPVHNPAKNDKTEQRCPTLRSHWYDEILVVSRRLLPDFTD